MPTPRRHTTHSLFLPWAEPTTTSCTSCLCIRLLCTENRARKAAGPDGISSRLLKSCADQLCGIFGYTFNLSLKLGRVPQLWKTSCIVPVPKTPHPKELNSYRPVALTSHLMKTLERLVLVHLRPLVSSFMDPLQFAYQPDIGVDDAVVIYLLHTSLTHLEKAGSTVRIMFFDFSSAFNTIQPRLLGDKLQLAGVDHHLHYMDSGLPHTQTTVYGDDREYRGLIQDFADWCLWNNLQINAGKTKELVVDFRRRSHSPPAPDTLTALGSSFSERLLHPRCVKERRTSRTIKSLGRIGIMGQAWGGAGPPLEPGLWLGLQANAWCRCNVVWVAVVAGASTTQSLDQNSGIRDMECHLAGGERA
ncbi:hypothetical protein L3Q82_001474 [Scortum barcoo]|uniref:Uncharacterized protein n=1 Tax=Scortum barcoo TaxID=214431 RepID=A0ACB8W7N9_9TELE|nr:hypothetical protein L3Q82_001474 [Scortum barcoo]